MTRKRRSEVQQLDMRHRLCVGQVWNARVHESFRSGVDQDRWGCEQAVVDADSLGADELAVAMYELTLVSAKMSRNRLYMPSTQPSSEQTLLPCRP